MTTPARLILVLAACLPACLSPRPAVAAPPNIVVIVSDDQGYNDLGILNEEVRTPNLDRLAKTGVRLTNFYVAWPACTPSRASFLTGRYPQRNGMYDMVRNEAPDYGYRYSPREYAVSFERIGGLDEREQILPAYLKQTGYVSGIFGKWDLGMQRRYLPLQKGFDVFYGFVNTGIDYFTHERYGVPSMYAGNAPTQANQGTYCTTLFRREAEKFLHQHHNQPFFLYLPFNAPHTASNLDPAIRSAPQAPPEYKQQFPHLKDELRKTPTRYSGVALTPTPEKQRLEYLASLLCMDEAIGSVLDLLDRYQLTENTIVIFFSDNGGGAGSRNTPLRGGKGKAYEGGVRVCALIRGPGLPSGGVNDSFVTSLDLLPTLLKQSGVNPPENLVLDGNDIWSTLQGQAESPRTGMYWQNQAFDAARIGHWKWIRTAGKEELYDLSADLAEKTNLASQQPERTGELRQKFETWVKDMEAAEPRGPFRDY
ncbi:arylsulfatase B [Planctomicrobium sp. SH664]|uniref:arylsulfatase B n=1 Tax=Planctomicrobium sp. SH664 TaxID=3448125 RepID=UPI003F5C04FB